jgi:single-strand DNA-binding protein
MKKTQNHVQLVGYLGQDPICKKARNGSTLARMRMATDFFRRDEQGILLKKTTWHDILAWDSLAEKIPNNFIKGSHVMIQGSIIHRSYENESGDTRHVTEIRATQVLNLDR